MNRVGYLGPISKIFNEPKSLQIKEAVVRVNDWFAWCLWTRDYKHSRDYKHTTGLFLIWLFMRVSLYHFNDMDCIDCKLYKITLDVLVRDGARIRYKLMGFIVYFLLATNKHLFLYGKWTLVTAGTYMTWLCVASKTTCMNWNVHTWASVFLRHLVSTSCMVPFWPYTDSGSVPILGGAS
jgi:hypothetical protein